MRQQMVMKSMKTTVFLMIVFTSIICGEESCRIESVDSVPSGCYVAKSLNNTDAGRTIEQIYGKLVKVVVSRDVKLQGVELTKISQTFAFQIGTSYKLQNDAVSVIFVFENKYAANGHIGKGCITVDSNYFKSP